jgi:hypothetical protein
MNLHAIYIPDSYINMTLQRFAEKYRVIQETWGYRYPGGYHSAYESKTHNGLDQFQRLTDYLMRFLEQGSSNPGDEARMYIDYDFYVEGGAFNMTDDVLKRYLKECGPYFKETRKICSRAYKYLAKCPPSSTRCFLQVSLQWMKVVRKYYMRYEKKKQIRIRKFKRLLKATAIAECQAYVQKEYDGTLSVNTVKDAILQVQEYDADTSSGTSDDTSDEDVQLRL